MKMFKQSVQNILQVCFFLFGVPLLLITINNIASYAGSTHDIAPRFGLLAVFAIMAAPVLVPFGLYQMFKNYRNKKLQNIALYVVIVTPIIWEFYTSIVAILTLD